MKEYAEKNKEHFIEYRRGRAKESLVVNQRWRENNREHVNAKARKRREDPKNRLASNMRNRISSALRGGKGGRHWEDLVDYTLDELKQHLESKFLLGMTWDNYGKYGWEVDHIVPVNAFDFSSPDDPAFKECFALSNLQPLWAKDNLSKNDKILVNGEYVYVHILRKTQKQGSEKSCV